MTADAYYKKKIYLAQVDKNNHIIDQVERWKAHEYGILHRGFTVILKYQDSYILQHRKNPVFDGCWDLTFSSHQFYQGDQLVSDTDVIFTALDREWNIGREDMVGELVELGKVYYKTKDPNSIFAEHEIDYVYKGELKKLPTPNLDYAYGISKIITLNALTKYNTAPWVEKIIEEKKIILQQTDPELR